MRTLRRAVVPGGSYFFTVVTAGRRPILTTATARGILRRSLRKEQELRPFRIDGFVLLPDHLHCIWTLPGGDADYARRWASIKQRFSRAWRSAGGTDVNISSARRRSGYRGVWQPRFWEHVIRDDRDRKAILDYIHFNPVKHGLAKCPHEWIWSSFHRYAMDGNIEHDWACGCHGKRLVPNFETLRDSVGE